MNSLSFVDHPYENFYLNQKKNSCEVHFHVRENVVEWNILIADYNKCCIDIILFYHVDILITCSQLLDLPGIIEGAKDGKGRGRQVIAGEKTHV